MSVSLAISKPKAVASAVQGRITVLTPDGSKVAQWGGTECYLSRERKLMRGGGSGSASAAAHRGARRGSEAGSPSACLVVTHISNRKRRTLFPLHRVTRVLCFHVQTGKLTLTLPHAQYAQVSVFIETAGDVEELKLMAATLQDRAAWSLLPCDIAAQGTAAARAQAYAGRGHSLQRSLVEREPLSEAIDDGAFERDSVDGDRSLSRSRSRDGQSAEMRSDELAAADRKSELGELAHTRATEGLAEAAAAAPVVMVSTSLFDDALTSETPAPSLTHSADSTAAVTTIIDAVLRGHNVFATGPAPAATLSVKATLLRELLLRVAAPHIGGGPSRRVALTAVSGPGARVLSGSTLADFTGAAALFTAGAGAATESVEAVASRILTHRSHRQALENWLSTDVLVVDGINALPARVFALLSELGQRVRQESHRQGDVRLRIGQYGADESGARDESWATRALEQPFGGLQLLVLGDFLTVPPATAASIHEGEEVLPPFSCPVWAACEFTAVALTAPEAETEEERRYTQFLHDTRVGQYTVAVDDVVSACLQRATDARAHARGAEHEPAPVVVTASRASAAQHNQRQLKKLDRARSEVVRYASEDYAALPGASVDAETDLPSLLELCVGAQVLLLATAPAALTAAAPSAVALPFVPSPGSVGVVVGFTETDPASARAAQPLPIVRFVRETGRPNPQAFDVAEVIVGRVALHVYADMTVSVPCAADADLTEARALRVGWRDPHRQLLLSRAQLPLTLAFALSARDLLAVPSLPSVQLSVTEDWVCDGSTVEDEELLQGQWGLLYTAMSRVRSERGLYLTRFDRALARKCVSRAAVAFYRALLPLSAAEEAAERERRTADKAVLAARKKERRASKRARRDDRADAEEPRPRPSPSPSRSTSGARATGRGEGSSARLSDRTPSVTGAHSGALAPGSVGPLSLGIAQDSVTSTSETMLEMLESSQAQRIVRGLLMDDDDA